MPSAFLANNGSNITKQIDAKSHCFAVQEIKSKQDGKTYKRQSRHRIVVAHSGSFLYLVWHFTNKFYEGNKNISSEKRSTKEIRTIISNIHIVIHIIAERHCIKFVCGEEK